jgi:hypothetical protein
MYETPRYRVFLKPFTVSQRVKELPVLNIYRRIHKRGHYPKLVLFFSHFYILFSTIYFNTVILSMFTSSKCFYPCPSQIHKHFLFYYSFRVTSASQPSLFNRVKIMKFIAV